MSDKTSELWDHLSTTLFETVDDKFIETFREPGGPNNRLAAWDPFDKTARYFKFLLFSQAMAQPAKFFDLYRQIGNVNIGNPIFVKVHGCKVNIDYLFSIEEFMFVSESIPPESLASVIEIGAGFGRTCHAFATLLPSLQNYTIVDLPSMLSLSKAVLQSVVPDQMSKISFVNALEASAWKGLSADLVININSFQEMPEATIEAYYDDIVDNCTYSYIKNPVGKYRPESVGLVLKDSSQFYDVFSLGRCRDIIDLFDDYELSRARKTYVEAYRPSGAKLIAERPLGTFAYYQHALYKRETAPEQV